MRCLKEKCKHNKEGKCDVEDEIVINYLGNCTLYQSKDEGYI